MPWLALRLLGLRLLLLRRVTPLLSAGLRAGALPVAAAVGGVDEEDGVSVVAVGVVPTAVAGCWHLLPILTTYTPVGHRGRGASFGGRAALSQGTSGASRSTHWGYFTSASQPVGEQRQHAGPAHASGGSAQAILAQAVAAAHAATARSASGQVVVQPPLTLPGGQSIYGHRVHQWAWTGAAVGGAGLTPLCLALDSLLVFPFKSESILRAWSSFSLRAMIKRLILSVPLPLQFVSVRLRADVAIA